MAKNAPRKQKPENNQNRNDPKANTVTAIITKTAVTFSGPLPHPAILREYEELCPGAARKIILSGLAQSTHRMDRETEVVHSQISNEFRGQWMAFFIVMIVIIATVVVTVYGYPWVGGVMCGSTLISIVSIFVIGKNIVSSEIEEKKKLDEGLKRQGADLQSVKTEGIIDVQGEKKLEPIAPVDNDTD